MFNIKKLYTICFCLIHTDVPYIMRKSSYVLINYKPPDYLPVWPLLFRLSFTFLILFSLQRSNFPSLGSTTTLSVFTSIGDCFFPAQPGYFSAHFDGSEIKFIDTLTLYYKFKLHCVHHKCSN